MEPGGSMHDGGGDMTLRDYGRIIARRKLIVGVPTLVAVAIALVITFLTDPVYEAEARMLVDTRAEIDLFEAEVRGWPPDEERAVETAVELIQSSTVRAKVADVLGLERLPPEVRAHPVRQTDVVAVKVRSSDARTAQVLADAYIEAFIEVRREQARLAAESVRPSVQRRLEEIDTELAEMSQFDPRYDRLLNQRLAYERSLDRLEFGASLTTGSASMEDPATEPTSPVEPQPVRNVALAAAVGLFIGLASAFAVDYLDDSIKTPDDLRRLSGLPVLASVPRFPDDDPRPIALTRPSSPAAEAYRGLRTGLQNLAADSFKVLQVTSSGSGEGTTTTTVNLAVVMAHQGYRVLLVDGDQRSPRLHQLLQVSQSPGLTDVLWGRPVPEVVRAVTFGESVTVDVVPSGTPSSFPSETLDSTTTRKMLVELADGYDIVLVDSAPVVPVTDAVALARNVDAVIVVVEAGSTSDRSLRTALERLDQVAPPTIGVVLNGVKQ